MIAMCTLPCTLHRLWPPLCTCRQPLIFCIYESVNGRVESGAQACGKRQLMSTWGEALVGRWRSRGKEEGLAGQV